MDYQTQFDLNINKVDEIFNEIFNNLDICRKFTKLFVEHNELDYGLLDQNQREKIKNAIDLLVTNARVEQTRKLQQQYYMEVLSVLGGNDFISTFEQDEKFRIKFMQLLIVFNDKDNLHDKDAQHHIFIAQSILNAAKKI